MKNLISKTARSVETVHTHTHTHTHTCNLYVRRKINKNITIFLLFIIFIILNTGNTKAVLQANGNTSAIYGLNDWMLNVRKMEEAGGAMGLGETLNSDLTSSSDSNNIDVHMEKNTEYGALAILSASSYGNPNVIASGDTTTGNATGVVMNLNSEWVAAGASELAYDTFKNAVSRYKDIYNYQTYEFKEGDAMTETAGWHSSKFSWNTCYGYSVGRLNALLRSYSGSIFSYMYGGKTGETTDIRKKYSSRAVVVSGQGL